ncbi:MAG TPA: RNA 2',3'-cyclic phosphodiesterase [Solirubrobacterales bacterium]|jgi:2'-5' RNA ligase|nr:RNA 2',3'-cyclic phosphodiesterase [Solirubrobacterales bacterium]
MTKPADRTSRVRLFLALDLADAVRDGLGSWGARELVDPALRPVPAGNLHITLAFLGQRPRGDVERVAAVVEGIEAPAPRIELLDPVGRPERGRPRLFAVPAVSPAATRMQSELSEILTSERLYEPEKRPFWPHVTVARVRAEGRGSRRPQAVQRVPGELPAALREPCFCRRLTLYRSELQPSGARYVPLAQVKLLGPGQQ